MKKSHIYSALFFIGGLGLIIASFFLFLKDCQQEKLFYLNLVVTCIVYSITLFRFTDILGPVDKVAGVSAGYGFKWYGIYMYIPLASALIVTSIIFKFGFNFSLIVHLSLLFLLLFLFFIGNLVNNNVNEVTQKTEQRKSGLKEIAGKLDNLEISCRLSEYNSSINRINNLRECVRFITASDNPQAIALEDKLIEKISLMTTQINSNSLSSEAIDSEFNECMTIVEMRKKLN